MNPVYITSVGAFLPNAPVDNAHMEHVLGQVRGAPSRLRERVLEQNGIRSRHYALVFIHRDARAHGLTYWWILPTFPFMPTLGILMYFVVRKEKLSRRADSQRPRQASSPTVR